MPTLKDILDDAQFGDDVQFDFNGNKIPLKELRAMRANTQAEEQRIAGLRQKAEKDALEAADVLAKLIDQQRNSAPPPAPKGSDEWEKDPIYQPILNKYNPLFDGLKKLTDTITAQKATLDRAQAIYAIDRMRGEFNRYAEKDGKIKGKTFEELAQDAVKSNTLDAFGAPTLVPIVDRLTEPDRLDRYAEQKVKDARAKWEAEERAAATSKPGSSVRFKTQKSDKAPITKIDDLTSDAVLKEMAIDPDFAAAMEGGKVQ